MVLFSEPFNGLDLNDIHWKKFKASCMFDTSYYLRRSKMVTYQIAMLFGILSNTLGEKALAGKSRACPNPCLRRASYMCSSVCIPA
jgi:hypothetical protein